MLKVIFTT